jgi:hypothetical protein
MDVWVEIEEFPNYAVSNRGLVCNEGTGRILSLSTNQSGVVNVGLVKDHVQYKRSVATLVAKAFLPPPPEPRFDTPLHLNGNRDHNFVENLVWRPRPFAIAYREQLKKPYKNRIEAPILNVDTGEIFESSLAAAKKYGLLERAVVMAALNEGVRVFPTGHQYRLL